MHNSNIKGLTRCVIDPSHESWVLGGLMRELAIANQHFNNHLLVLPPPRRIFKHISVKLKLLREESLLFSSLTPLVNYLRFPFWTRKQALCLWFTHKEGDFSQTELKCLKKTTRIYVHSSREAARLKNLGCENVTVAIGAIEPKRFVKKSKVGKDIVWVGTPSARKAPWELLNHVRKLPHVQFRLLGNGWEASEYWAEVTSLKNLSYIPILHPLTSEDFDGCFAFLMTSEVEGGPMPLLEALCAGLAPIATDCGFVRDLFEHCDISEFLIYNGITPLEDQIRFLELNWPKYESRARQRALELNFTHFSEILSGKGF
jgi:glycosyltransferase involved in cell wall biosynthesis